MAGDDSTIKAEQKVAGVAPVGRAHPADDPEALAALADDAKQRIGELDRLIQRLAPDALSGDADVVTELAALRSERAAATAMLETVGLARSELADRQVAAEVDARRRARHVAYGEAVKVREALEAEVGEVNRHAGEFAAAVRRAQDLAGDLRAAARRAGISGLRPFSATEFTAALAREVDEHGIRSLLELGPVQPAHRRPLRAPTLPPRPAERIGAPERPDRREPLPEVEVASGPAAYYRQLRGDLGCTMQTAVETVRHVYGEAATVEVLQRAEDEIEAETAVAA
jgi:hypothetical protein